MALETGMTVPIPCRSCGQACIPFRIEEEGRHSLECPKCGEVTVAIVSLAEGAPPTIHTEPIVPATVPK